MAATATKKKATTSKKPKSWTCARCEVTVQWMPGHDAPKTKSPANWSTIKGKHYCLACRRDLAAEEGLKGVSEKATLAERNQAQAAARIEFEVKRAPDRADGEIAKSCGSSVAAVQKARERLSL
jgi:hypothetical protein